MKQLLVALGVILVSHAGMADNNTGTGWIPEGDVCPDIMLYPVGYHRFGRHRLVQLRRQQLLAWLKKSPGWAIFIMR